MYKIIALSTLSYTLALQTANSRDLQDFLDKPSTSNEFLNSRAPIDRSKRHNSGFFEEVKQGSVERECHEEKCSYEELSEIVTDEDAKARTWKELIKNCEVGPLCSAEGTEVCIQTWRAKKCVCREGFNGDLCQDDIDECDATLEGYVQKCDGFGQLCNNFAGGFECGCQNGYESVMGLDTDEGLTCEDIDECALGAHNCESDDLCNNTDGTFECQDAEFITEPTTTEVVTTESDYGSGEDVTDEVTATEEPTTMFVTDAPTTTHAPKYGNQQCGEANICNYNNGQGGCDHQCVPLCDEDCDCSYQCKCNVGYALSCDGISCVRV